MSFFHRWFLSERPIGCTTASLETRVSPQITIQKLRNHVFTKTDIINYSFQLFIWCIVMIINPASIIKKLFVIAVFIALFFIPITSQFFFNALPIFTWLALYFSSSTIPQSWRNVIAVKWLASIETINYGDNLSEILATTTNTPLDVVAWIPYGVFHFGAPFFVAIILFLFGPPTVLRSYAFAFGYMNLFGVITQYFLPAAPPWYKILHGLDPAHYGMKGSPGGLGRIDALLGISVYTDGFSNSSVIFGAFPSLHSGCATMEALFFNYCFPQLRFLWVFYVCWLWWSTMYLTHHYFVDLVAGSVLTFVIFTYTAYTTLPLRDPKCFCRWSYSEIVLPDVVSVDPLYLDREESLEMGDLPVVKRSE